MANVIQILIVIVMFICVNVGAQNKPPIQKPGKKAEAGTPLINQKMVEKWLKYLASDSMKGRKNGSPEMKEAANWIAGNYKAFGLKPFKENDGYMQHYFIKNKKDSIAESNVIGYIEGCDPALKTGYIVISAHFDHLGIGKPVMGDSIFNGANDNASGICGLLGIAETFYKMKAKPARTIVFAAFSGEEISASGSRYHVRHINFPVTAVYLNINIEMIGLCRNLGANNYSITGPGFSNLKEILHDYNKNSNWKLIDTAKNLETYFFKSDNVAFANIKRTEKIVYGVPAHSFIIWNEEESLHKPNDEAKFINYENMTNFIQYLSGAVLYLSACKTPIEWTDSRIERIKD